MKSIAEKFMRTSLLLLVCTAILGLEACGTMRKLAGVDRTPPDEFRVVNKPPLTMPPDYNLMPPKSGEPTPQQLPPAAQVVNALFPGRTTMPPPASAGEQALLNSVGAGEVSSNIRSMSSDQQTIVVEKGVLLQDVLTLEERTGGPDGSNIERTDSQPLEDDGGRS